jgi:hypothetical protein
MVGMEAVRVETFVAILVNLFGLSILAGALMLAVTLLFP